MCHTPHYVCKNCISFADMTSFLNFSKEKYFRDHPEITPEQRQSMFIGYKSICCSVQCYFASGILHELDMKRITPEEAKLQLQDIGVDKDVIQKYIPNVRDFLLNRINFNEQEIVPNFEYNQPEEQEEQMVDRYSKKHSRRENKHGM